MARKLLAVISCAALISISLACKLLSQGPGIDAGNG